MRLIVYDAFNRMSPLQVERVSNFLFRNFKKSNIPLSAVTKSINYAIKERAGFGGVVYVIEDKEQVVGALVVNRSGMEEYFPEYILVYVAVHEDYRRKGLGSKIIKYGIEQCKGEVIVLIQDDNPVKSILQKFGFCSTSNIEMKLLKT